MRVSDVRPWVDAGVLTPSNDVGWLPGEWVGEALCAQVDPDLWFPEEQGQSWRVAAKLCHTCQVRDLCLAYAVVTDERIGVWGGLAATQRYRIEDVVIPGTSTTVQLIPRQRGPKQAFTNAEALAGSTAAIARTAGVSERTVQRARRRAREEQVDAAA
ncbi:WhiB family transcriptional regulator [Micromonospora echinospora]